MKHKRRIGDFYENGSYHPKFMKQYFLKGSARMHKCFNQERNSLQYMELKGSLPCSQVLPLDAILSHMNLAHNLIYFPKIHFSIILLPIRRPHKLSFLFRCSATIS
jgi:hypothetical protein